MGPVASAGKRCGFRTGSRLMAGRKAASAGADADCRFGLPLRGHNHCTAGKISAPGGSFPFYYYFYLYTTMQRFGTCTEALLFFSFHPKAIRMSIQYVTKETLEQMKAELQQLRGVERPAASRAIAEAREKGDLRENAEYDAAKEAQGLLEAKIAHLEGQIATARILDESTIDTSKVSILTRVKVTNLNTKKQVTYQIVSEKEADLKAGKISFTSPIGKGLLGKAVGDIAEVTAPAGLIKFKVEEITL
jgi:transcription elongation factor GreA